MKKRTTFLILGIFILVLIVVRLVWITLQATPEHPKAVQGVLDLRGWSLEENGPITLDGEWEFYPDRLIKPDLPDQDSGAEKEYIRVPGNWKIASSPTMQGYGSYRLRILMDPQADRLLAVRIQEITVSSEFFVDGISRGHSGQPAAVAEQYIPNKRPYTTSFHTGRDQVELVIHVANFHNDTAGGLVKSLLFGPSDALQSRLLFSMGMQLLLCTVLLIHMLYAFILYWIGARQSVLLLFALLNFSTILMTLLSDDRLLLTWLPISYVLYVKLIYLSFIGINFSLVRFANALLPNYAMPRINAWYSVICALLAACILVLPIQYAAPIGLFIFNSGVAGAVILVWLPVRSTLRGEEDTIFLLSGATFVMINMLWNYFGMIKSVDMYFYPIDLIAAFFAFAAFWFKRYMRTANRTEKLARMLQLADKQKDDFLANTSHELRNPLHGILNIAQSMKDNGNAALDERNIQSLDLLITVGRRMSYMLNDLLDMSRLRESGIVLHTNRLQLEAVASGVLDMLRFMTEGKPIRLINRIPDTFPYVIADENRLIQVMFNLLHNAVKYTHEGSVTIRAEAGGDGYARIVIEDTGIGMSEETLQRIFRPYEQGDSGITAIGGGIGLGLSIAKQLVELHGGHIETSSAAGQGSVFSFTLPLADPSAEGEIGGRDTPPLFYSEAAPAVLPEVGQTPIKTEVYSDRNDRARILAVDDDAINLSILVNLLASDHYEIVTAASGTEALSILDNHVWDLVITDVMMPRMSGYELTQTIRLRFSISELPVLLLTARSRPEDIQAGFQAGANDYVMKPVEADELKSRVKALTELRASIRERMQMEAAWLQAQIQPHFLFNTLSSIAALSELDTERMRQLLDAFGNYLQTSFQFANTEKLVPIHHELELVRSYLFIERARFDQRLQVIWEVDPNMDLDIPPLSIQPLVENAVRHGITKRSRGGTVRICISDHPEYADITIADDGIGMSDETLQTVLYRNTEGKRGGVGLLNTDRRLKQLYGRGLQIESIPDGGTAVSFRAMK
ncbi:response regulator [Paenibacillus piri]|uniref:histidine kinase n=2 Tax=Paenibacillus piri TaxID=2547395 RepID=A0A4R5L054_9BACL|nr:response regulator [Paenibacillus piri]